MCSLHSGELGIRKLLRPASQKNISSGLKCLPPKSEVHSFVICEWAVHVIFDKV